MNPLKTASYISLHMSLVFGQIIPYNQEFQVNTYYASYQVEPRVCSLSTGGFLVCWASDGQDGSSYGIFGQLFNNDGSRKGNEFQVNTYTDLGQSNPSAIGLSNDGFVICWESQRQDGSYSGIYGQVFNDDGSRRGEEFQVNTYTSHNQQNCSVIGLADSGFAVFWQSEGQDGSGLGIFGQFFNNDGSRRGTEFLVNADTDGDQFIPSAASLSGGGFVICWENYNQNGGGYGVYGQLFNSEGFKEGIEFQVNESTAEYQNQPRVAGLANGGFVVCWGSYGQDGNGCGIFGQLFNSNGSKQSTKFQVNTTVKGDQFSPCVVGFKEGGFAVFWESEYLDGSGHGIFGQLFNSDYSRKGSEFRINTYTSDHQINPTVAGFSDRRFVVCWASSGQDGSGFGIYGKYFLDHEIAHNLEHFSLCQPDNDLTVYSTNILFLWRNASSMRINLPWEVEYTLCLGDDENFRNPIIAIAIYDTTYTVQNLTPGTTYFWKVLAKNIAGDSLWSTETNLFYVSENATSIEHPVPSNPETFELYANFPNPFNPETTIRYTLPQGKAQYRVQVRIYDTLGRLVITLLDENQQSGYHSLKWNGKNSLGTAMPSGVYYCLVQAGEYNAVQKMLLVR